MIESILLDNLDVIKDVVEEYLEPEELDLEEYLLQWLDVLAAQQLSEHTLEAYHRDVSHFLNYCDVQRLTIANLEVADLRQYMSFCIEQHHWSNQTIQRTLSAIRNFMQWLQHQGIHHNAKFKDFSIKRDPRALPGMLSPESLIQLLEQPTPEHPQDQWLWYRDKAMLELLYSSGLRLNELVSLPLSAIDWVQHLIRVTGKGNKTRIIPFGEKAALALQQWINARQMKKPLHEMLFISRSGDPISARQVQKRIKFQALRAGLSADIYPHLIRHCFASHLLSASGDLRAVQEMLGHESITTTEIYTHLDTAFLKETLEKFHPRYVQ